MVSARWWRGRPIAVNIPFVRVGTVESLVLQCHIARANPIREVIARAPEVLLTVMGPDAYISPDWYLAEDQVVRHPRRPRPRVPEPRTTGLFGAHLRALTARSAAPEPKRPLPEQFREGSPFRGRNSQQKCGEETAESVDSTGESDPHRSP